MNASRNPNDLPADVRAAISSFLKACQNEARPFATKEALEAVRNIFPDLDINDSDLIDGLISEASVAGFDVGLAEETRNHRRLSVDTWEDEGGAVHRKHESRQQLRQTRRNVLNDTAGTRRRARETKERNRLL
ncbi:hypothetical protein QEZ48_19510 [Aquamicrobium lusatiense]|uniref:hypothetical protein n=1 Tax=Aquamicrobium TaxID=69278 RepID=UPI002457727C|nr:MULTISPECIES: hypothetical protein [Aquamicrobium]MCK9552938.1 hypothetical protein [Aquamicrobium sp.]MDH4993007.1 hypothetical protein [Aquamicrobium lusatiense]